MIFVKSYIAYMDDKLKDRWKKLVVKLFTTLLDAVSFSGDKRAPMKGTDTNDLIAFLLDGITLILI